MRKCSGDLGSRPRTGPPSPSPFLSDSFTARISPSGDGVFQNTVVKFVGDSGSREKLGWGGGVEDREKTSSRVQGETK